jgi:Uma2 family endonuclease
MATDLALDDVKLDDEVIDFPWEVLTLEDFLRLPEIKPALEFIDGRIEQKMSPNLQHARIGQKLPARINEISEDAKLGLAFVEARCSFDGESYVPDISYFLWDRIPLDEEGRLAERVSISPDWSIEILSPGQTVAKLTARLERLVKKGVRLGWLIQPRKSRVFIVRPDQPVQIIALGEILDADPVLPGFALPVQELFGWLVIH